MLNYLPSEGLTPYSCLVSLLQDNKINKTTCKEFIGALRYKDPMLYT
jgi:hypothetical protein